MTTPDQDQLNLFLLNELERLNLLVSRMQQRGVLRPEDVAVVQLQQELKTCERQLRQGSRASRAAHEQAIADLRARISALEAVS